jgi:hypothetical protein
LQFPRLHYPSTLNSSSPSRAALFDAIHTELTQNREAAERDEGSLKEPVRSGMRPLASPTDVDIFISHASDDAIGGAIFKCISACFSVPPGAIRFSTIPAHGVPMGVEFRMRLEVDLQHCVLVIGVLTQAGVSSKWVSAELNGAHLLGKPIYCVLGSDVGAEHVPALLEGLQCASLSDKDFISTLVEQIEKAVGWTASDAASRQKAYREFEKQRLSRRKRALPQATKRARG